MKVLHDILRYGGNEFHVDDVDRIFAVRFSGVFNDSDFWRVVSRLEQKTPHIIKQKVGLYDETIPGAHAYEVFLVNGDMCNVPVWN